SVSLPTLSPRPHSPQSTLFPYTTLFRSALGKLGHTAEHLAIYDDVDLVRQKLETFAPDVLFNLVEQFKNRPEFDQNIVSFFEMQDRKSTRLNSSHDQISYAVFCLKKKII